MVAERGLLRRTRGSWRRHFLLAVLLEGENQLLSGCCLVFG